MFLIIRWALVPYLTDASIDTPVVSIFLGNKDATSWTRDLLLLARAFLGASLALYIFMPALSLFGDFDLTILRRDLCLALLGLSIIAWMGALIYHFCSSFRRTMTPGLSHYLILATALFVVGVVGVLLNRKNVLVVLMSVELILLAVNLNFIAFSRYLDDIHGQVFVFFYSHSGGGRIGHRFGYFDCCLS